MTAKPKHLHPVINRSAIENFIIDLLFEKPPKLIGASAETGAFNPVTKGKVTKRITAILNKASNAKIGVTGDTLIRMDSLDYRTQFQLVERVYKTKSAQYAKDMEVYMIRKFKESHPNVVINKSEIPATRLTTYNDFHFVYVVYNPK